MGNNYGIKRICLVPNVHGVGGMVSFKGRLVKGLEERGIEVSPGLRNEPYEAILVIGGTRDLVGLWRAKQRGVRIVQRLDGMNWIHRKKRTGWRHYLRAEYGNFILSFIRSRLADRIIYQSEFSRQWWEQKYGKTGKPWQVVHNGVDLTSFTPDGAGQVPADKVRVLLVEGTIGGGYEFGLETAVKALEKMQETNSRPAELRVVGRISEELMQAWKNWGGIPVTFTGLVAAENIPALDRSAHVFYAADLNPACPNAVIEALACGLPVAGFDTGALSEIVTEGSGVLVPYGGDPWKLDPPDIDGLARAIDEMVTHQADFRDNARNRAVKAFGLDRMVEGYLAVLLQ